MGLPAHKQDHKYTYSDYLTWPEEERWELIDGTAFSMSPAPLRIHQEILTILTSRFYTFFKDKPCKVYVAPFDVRLPKGDEADEAIDTVVQPDLSVICDKNKLDRRGCRGAPDLIVEIISPQSAGRDMKDKWHLYEQHGVKEYWLVFPDEKVVELFFLDAAGRYNRPERFKADETATSRLFPALRLELAGIFQELAAE